MLSEAVCFARLACLFEGGVASAGREEGGVCLLPACLSLGTGALSWTPGRAEGKGGVVRVPGYLSWSRKGRA